MADPDSFYDAAERRIEWLMAGFGAAATLFAGREVGVASGGRRSCWRGSHMAEFQVAEAWCQRFG